MAKKRRTYLPRIVGDKVMMPADLKRLHKYMLDIERIDHISDETRAVVESAWPELAHKLPPKSLCDLQTLSRKTPIARGTRFGVRQSLRLRKVKLCVIEQRSTCPLKSATSACASSNSAARCNWARRSRSFDSASI